ncbi:hypothetical protein ACHAQA_007613 [Verticillium albo-atrum]
MSSPPPNGLASHEPPYDIGSWSMGDDGFDLGVRINGKRFRIAVWADHFKNSPVAIESFLKVVAKMNEGDDSCDGLWDYLEWIVGHFLFQFQSLAPPIVHTGKLTLAHLAARESFECEFHMVQEKPVAGPVKPLLVEDDSEEFDAPTRNEIKKYDKIAASGLSPADLRTSRLYAVVVGSKGRLCGLIFHFIKSDERLTWAVDERTPLALREKWATQINDTVAKLHHLGITWGDVKADNVLINEERNAIVIDLEGGTTQDWVDREKEGTIEGDLQGLEKMTDFIFNDESNLRPPPLGPDDEPIVKIRGY